MKKIITLGLIGLSLFITSCIRSNITPEGQKEWKQYEWSVSQPE